MGPEGAEGLSEDIEDKAHVIYPLYGAGEVVVPALAADLEALGRRAENSHFAPFRLDVQKADLFE
jgi:hypothetical protein